MRPTALHLARTAVFVSCVMIASDADAQQYTLTVFNGINVYPHAINASGQVVGEDHGEAVIWSDGTMRPLGRLPDTYSCAAWAVNDGGQVVGGCRGIGVNTSFFWSADTGMTALPIPGWSLARGIDSNGHIVGYYGDSSDAFYNDPHAFFYRDGVVEDLGPGRALAINDGGQVVGARRDADTDIAQLWDDQGAHDLDGDEGWSVAYAVSASGLIVGSSGVPQYGYPSHAVAWTPDGLSNLGNLGRGGASALGINGDLIVGAADSRAFLYDLNGPGYAVDLNGLIAPSRYRLWTAAAINAAGQIVGTGDCCGEAEGFLLTPVTMNPR